MTTAPTYEDLLADTLPQVIENDKRYRAIAARFSELLGKGLGRTDDETKLMRLLGLLIEDYDRRHSLPRTTARPRSASNFFSNTPEKTRMIC